MTTRSASDPGSKRRGSAVARAMARDRAPRPVIRRALARAIVSLVGREGHSKWPHSLVWRLREFVYATPPAIAVFPAERDGAGGRRILLVTHDLSASGAPRLLVEITQILTAAGAEIVLLSPSDGDTRAEAVAAGATVIVDPATVRADAGIFALIADEVDAAICNTHDAEPAVTALAPVVPTIWYLHEVEVLEQHLAGPTLPALLRQPARLWAGSEMTAGLLRPFRSDVRTLPYGLDPIGTGPAPGTRDILRLAVFGSYEPRKGQDLLIAALDLLSPAARAQVQLTFYGRPLFAEFHADIAARAASMAGVEAAGPLDRSGYIAAMLECDAVVVPSRNDSLPLVSLDALGAGRVLMCSDATGTSAYLTSGVDGFVANGADAVALAAMLEQAVARRGDWAMIAEAGRAVFARSFSAANFAAQLTSEVDALTAYRAAA